MAGWVDGYTGRSATTTCSAFSEPNSAAWAKCFANLYAVTGKEHYLDSPSALTRKGFSIRWPQHRDELKGLHVNTHIPQVIAAARYYELTGDRHYRDIAEYFWDEVVSERSVTAPAAPAMMNPGIPIPASSQPNSAPTLPNDCCAYNMMKLTRHLFGWSA